MNQIVSSRNLFIDTSKDVGEGDNCDLELSNNTIRAMDGQALKLTLVNFTMHAPFYTVNINNNKAKFTSKINNTTLDKNTIDIEIVPKNYANVHDIANAFANKVKLAMQANVQTLLGVANPVEVKGIIGDEIEPLASEDFKNGDRILGFSLHFTNPHTLTPEEIELICDERDGEMYELLGADRVAADDNTSFDITVPGPLIIQIQGRYPMQRSSSSSVFLRLLAPSNNIESAALSGGGPYDTHTLSSNILGIFEQSSYEYIHYESRNDEFFAYLRTKELNSLRLVLTDKRNRPLGRTFGTMTQTAAGTGFFQSTRGSLHFQCVLRIDTLQVSIPELLSVKEHQEQKKGGVIVNLPSQSRFSSFVK